jgi:hypothetical protein
MIRIFVFSRDGALPFAFDKYTETRLTRHTTKVDNVEVDNWTDTRDL